MSSTDQSSIIASIRKIQETIALTIGVILAVTLSVYFFTYAMVVDKGLMTILWMMAISSLIFVLALFRLQTVSFFVARLWLGRKAEYQDVFPLISAHSAHKDST